MTERSLTTGLHDARDHLQPSLDHGLHALRVRVRLAVHAGVLEPAQLVAAAEHGEAAILHRAFAVMRATFICLMSRLVSA